MLKTEVTVAARIVAMGRRGVNCGLLGLLEKPEVTAECVVRFTPALPAWVLGHDGLSDGGALLRIPYDKESHAAASA